MREFCELRVDEEHVHLLFGPDEGKRLGELVRKIVIPTDDPRFKEVGRTRDRLRKAGKGLFFAGWNTFYRYTQSELDAAELFHIEITAVFEPTGEECGTVYDETVACSLCGAGRRRVSDLRLDLRKAPKTKDIAGTIAADEIIVSQRLAELITDPKLTGFELDPVHHKARYEDDPLRLEKVPTGRKLLRRAKAMGMTPEDWEFSVWLNRAEQSPLFEAARLENAERLHQKAEQKGKAPPTWYELVVTSKPARIAPPTRVGVGPFDEDSEGRFRCQRGDLIGLNLLSEIRVARDSWDGSDVALTEQYIGARRGLLVPSQRLLISRRCFELLQREKVKGYGFDVAYLV